MFARDFSFVLGSNVVRQMILIATGIIIARTLGPEGKGIYAVVLLLPVLAMTFGQLGLSQSIIYRIGRQHLPQEKVLGTVLYIDLVLSIGLVALTIVLARILSTTLVRGVDQKLIVLATLSIPSMLVFRHLQDMLRAQGRIQAFSIISLAEVSAILVGFTILLTLSLLTISWMIVIQLALGLMLTLVCLAVVARNLRGWLRTDSKTARGLLGYGLRAHIQVVFSNLESRFDILLLNAFLFPGQVGLYAVGVSAAHLVLYVTNAMGTVLFPRISSSSPTQVRQFLPRISRLSILLSALVGIGLVLIGRPVISMLYGQNFSGSYMPMVILLPGILALTLSRICGVYLQGVGRPGMVSAVAGLSFAVNLGANLVLIPRLGINGAALASTMSYTLGTILLLILFLRHSNLNLFQVVVPQRDDVIELTRLVGSVRRKLSAVGLRGAVAATHPNRKRL